MVGAKENWNLHQVEHFPHLWIANLTSCFTGRACTLQRITTPFLRFETTQPRFQEDFGNEVE